MEVEKVAFKINAVSSITAVLTLLKLSDNTEVQKTVLFDSPKEIIKMI